MKMQKLSGKMLINMLIGAANNLDQHKQMVDALNVFPVPDGDTGTNMSLTVMATARELHALGDGELSAVGSVLASASLRGARGNSGVILSQLFRGFAKTFSGLKEADAKLVAKALKAGVDTAYKAVKTPTEGTILTVARECAMKAITLSEHEDDILKVFEGALATAKETLDKTPDMLPVLKQAGVVDAGGQGLICILEGAFSALVAGQDVQLVTPSSGTMTPTINQAIQEQTILFPYCTEFIILKKEAKNCEKPLQVFLDKRGDSTVIIDDGEIVKVHIHTSTPGAVITEALKYGALMNIKIDNMQVQNDSLVMASQATQADIVTPTKEYGFVAVAAGEGLRNIFMNDLVVDQVIEGGQTMNPSTDDILKAVQKVPAKNVFVLPNNKNIIPAAEQVISLADRNVFVIPTRTIPQGISAMIGFDFECDAVANIKQMTSAIKHVQTGQVTYAVRKTSVAGKEIAEGDILGLLEGKIAVVVDNAEAALLQLIEKMVNDSSAMISVYYGNQTSLEQAQSVLVTLELKYPDLDVEIHDGGQPIYFYICAVE
ncbi:MAG: DAK2 domain-containing protein [Hyphomonadaceae bacterium]|nr:DAK2 domain-containing protein [Clostridia bacterium]